MLEPIRHIIRSADAAVARAYLSFRRERNALRTFAFHSLFRDEREIAANVVHPLQRTTVAEFREFVRIYQEHDYQFIGISDLLRGLDANGKYALITFDDGYFNNTRAIPVLEEFEVPAVFFISSDNVCVQKSFWWDVHWRENIARGMSPGAIVRDGRAIKLGKTEEIEAELSRRFGAGIFSPRGETDRPMSAAELRDFARCKYVELGNHTANHAILTNYSDTEMREQIDGAQEAIESISGVTPTAIAYPNGACSDAVVAASRAAGLKCGFTVRSEKTPLPLDRRPQAMMQIGRFMPHDQSPIEQQCRTYRSDLQLYSTFHEGYRRFTQRFAVAEGN